MKKTLSPEEKKELLNMANELFRYEPLFNYSISSDGVQATFSDVSTKNTYTEEFRKELETKLSKDSLNSYSLYQLGDYYFNTGDFTLARSYFQKSYDVLNLDEFKADSSRYYSVRGLLKKSLNDEGAFLDFEKSLSINPNDSIAINLYPWLIMSEGDYTTAKNKFAESLEQSNTIAASSYTGLVFAELMESFLQLINKVADNQALKAQYRKKDYLQLFDYSLTNKYGNRYNRITEVKNARIMADILGLSLKLMLFEPSELDEPILEYTKGDLKKLAELQEMIQSASKNNQMNEYSVNNNLGFIHYMQGNTLGAIEYFTKAIDAFPLSKMSDDYNPNGAFDGLLAMYYYKKDTANWRKTIERRIATEPLHANLAIDYRNLAIYYFGIGSMAKAKEWAKKAEAINPADMETLKLLAHLYFLDKMDSLTTFYSAKMNKVSCDSTQASKLFLQFAIYKLFNEDAQGAYIDIESARELSPAYFKGNRRCKLCNELEANYLKITQ